MHPDPTPLEPESPIRPPSSSTPCDRRPTLSDAAHSLVRQSRARLVRTGNMLLAKIRRALSAAAKRYYEAGTCLKELAKPGIADSLGFASLEDLCKAKLGMRRTKVRVLRRVVDTMSAEQFAALGIDRADALLELAEATPEDDTAAILAGATITLWPGGETLDVQRATTRQVRAAAKSVRAHYAVQRFVAGPPPMTARRGRTLTVEEQASLAEFNRRLTERGGSATVVAVATRPGQPARFRIEGLALAQAEVLVRLLCAG